MTIAKILGHSDIKMTMRYAHPTPENRRRAVEVLAGNFGHKSRDAIKKWTRIDDMDEGIHSILYN